MFSPLEDTLPADSALLGDLFEKEADGNLHTNKTFQVGMRAVQHFSAVLQAKGASFSDLDVWLVAFSRWILAPECLFDEPHKIEQCKTERQELCDLAGVPMRTWCPNTLKCHINVLAMK